MKSPNFEPYNKPAVAVAVIKKNYGYDRKKNIGTRQRLDFSTNDKTNHEFA